MRAVERQAIASGQVTGLELMERAGAGVVEAVLAEWPELRSGRAVVLCGPGNNGGDGFVVARLLKGLGWEVEVFLYGDPEKLPPDARVNHGRWGGEVAPFRNFDGFIFEGTDIVFDALFGTGLTRTTNVARGLWNAAKGFGCRLVAVDIVSGICADSGRYILDDASDYFVPPFDLTVTFHCAKPGHFLADGPMICGKLRVVDIGLQRARADLWLCSTPRGLEKDIGHKFTYGHALILSGPAGACGAARMTARAALRVGAGLVTLACPPEALSENAARLDAVMLKALAGAEALTALLSDPRINALCLGPGLGLDDRAVGLVRAALEASRPRGASERPGLSLVLDADALTLLARDPGLFALLHAGCILTPHGGEFARLFPDLATKLEAPAVKGPAFSKVDATREAATRAGCTLLYKGPDTVIASPGGICAIHAAVYDRAAPWLATAGSGDVLAGLITGLMARGFMPQHAAETGAWLHVEAARAFGPGLIAEDLPEMIPQVFRTLGL
ncbi:NAD(P)H-hydrate dehydratase [Rhodobacter sp. KR11]|uniref:NAD(P)H-hydrate dehydratase n=1 Tax=Rhodobacter sp. KR11 TaxID=2974588 RepID=UPI002223EB1C|nr:NAD(P)H-hydrate dehydratase [Rhodobacter sp. KR11]MCW1917984.1 NAD(P)H-hydrate dehydratase [Rhodobacter sp. KR11]